MLKLDLQTCVGVCGSLLMLALLCGGCGDASEDHGPAKPDAGAHKLDAGAHKLDAGVMHAGAAAPDAATPCSGLAYFLQRGWCAATYDDQMPRTPPGGCSRGLVYTGTCSGLQVWDYVSLSMAFPMTCVYRDNVLVGASICSDTTEGSWACGAGAQRCLQAGEDQIDLHCRDELTTPCGSDDAGIE